MTGSTSSVSAVQRVPGVQRLVLTSTQFVGRPGYEPANDRDYAPHTLYGESKVRSEEAIRQADLDVECSIVRPTRWRMGSAQRSSTLRSTGFYPTP